ncbi:Protein Shroom1 [Merluccius polli]|uniref:Protein Shroom1 n=1 Tax=Merluccius polli TaxID=89951 RepID=A0AA47NVT7_MERPO|nr:Protein Shroom1 [Merluccius polli]
MDSFGLHFERMTNLDLHPLSLPISRLSPAKSNSSITDQLTHHQHGKGDSAYSSFSGGSTVPDYPSPFLQDELQPSSFNHYAHLKYVKAVYQPCQVHQSETRTMDQLFHSVEAISQHRNINNQRQNGHERCNADSKGTASLNPPHSHHPPPPPPARLDSFVATRNLENTRGHHQGTKAQPQQHILRTHKQQMPFGNFHAQTLPQDTLKLNQTAVPEPRNSNLVYGGWQETQQEPPQSHQHLSYCPPPQHHDLVKFSNSEQIFLANQSKFGQQQMSVSLLSKPPLQGTNQMENQKNRQRARSSGDNVTNKGSNHFDRHRKRAHSAKESPQSLGPEPNRSSSPSSSGQNLTTSSIQHKGQFYFVTGKQTGTGGRKLSVSSCASEAGSESSTVVETFRLREKDRCHSTMDNFFRPTQQKPYQSTEALSDKMQVYTSVSQEQDSVFKNQDENLSTMSNGPSPMTIQPSHSFELLEQMHLVQSQEIGRHTVNHPIFFCGPEENYAPQGNQRPTKEATTMISNDQRSVCKREDLAKKGRRQPLGDVASERINKETTPLLYHLTGANRAALKPKKDVIIHVKGEETILNKAGHKDIYIRSKQRSLQIETVAEVGGEVISNACNMLDDSFKKYYKEQLKDAQSKVLRETSFKRKDLQLSWPHREQIPQLRPTVIHHFSASQDSETSTGTLTPSVASWQMEIGSIKKEVMEKEKDEEDQRENGRPLNVAQPQVARIGGRKRLTQEQKKMCFSEPEKLHQLGDSPNHSACHSLGNELEHFISTECNREELGQHGEQGLVAVRRKMFETRGRALSASSLSKTNLKNLQHKALVEYMERKTGHKVAEPQQPGPQLPQPPKQRHSIGEKPVGWAAKSQTASTGSQGFKKKPNRPHSAGRILDSSSSSIRYAQFFSAQSAQSGLVHGSGQPSWKESQSAQGKSASVGSLLSQTEPTDFFRNRSRSTPHTFQAHGPEDDSSPANAMETQSFNRTAIGLLYCSEQGSVSDESVARPAALKVQQRVVAQRGKSMEELGTLRCSRPLVLSKSSEQLDQLWSTPERPGREKRSLPSVLDGGRRDEMAHLQGLEQARQGLETLGLEKTQPLGGQKQTHRRTLSKADSASQLGGDQEIRPVANAEAKDLSRSASPASSYSPRVRIPSGTPSSQGSVLVEARLSVPGMESCDPQSPSGPETRERDIQSTSASPSLLSQARSPKESKSESRDRKSTSGTVSEQEWPLDDPRSVTPPPDFNQEVEPELPAPPLPPPPDVKDESPDFLLTDDVFESISKSTSPESPTQNGAPLQSPSNSVSEAEPIHAVDVEERVETMNVADPKRDPKPEEEEEEEEEERGTQEGETESPEDLVKKPRWVELVVAVVKVDRSLASALYPLTNRKTALMLMEQLLSEDTLLMEEHYKKKQEQRGPAESAGVQPLLASDEDDHTVPCSDPQIQADITEKKRILVSYAEERLQALEESRTVLRMEVQENVVRGEAVLSLVREHCLPMEVERYSLFIGDLERVVSLLLCLSARLARVQNALSTVDQHTDAEEKESLDSRHRLLCKQREDAKDLKDNLDRRESVVSAFLGRQLSAAQLGDYRRFVQTTASLLIRQKDLEERWQLAEEQAEALRFSLPAP